MKHSELLVPIIVYMTDSPNNISLNENIYKNAKTVVNKIAYHDDDEDIEKSN